MRTYTEYTRNIHKTDATVLKHVLPLSQYPCVTTSTRHITEEDANIPSSKQHCKIIWRVCTTSYLSEYDKNWNRDDRLKVHGYVNSRLLVLYKRYPKNMLSSCNTRCLHKYCANHCWWRQTCACSELRAESLVGWSAASGVHCFPGANLQFVQCLMWK